MKPDAADRLLRDMAARGLVAAIHPPTPEWENDPSFSLPKLPVDSQAWFGGTVEVRVPLPGDSRWTTATFMFWSAGGELVWVSAVYTMSGPDDVGFSLLEAMVAPMHGEPRRPTKVFLQDEAMANALRESGTIDGHDVSGVVEIAVGTSPELVKHITAFLTGVAQTLAEQDAQA